ncbi:S8 family peptidase [Alkalicoccobacillus gibsonii]|uniref:S8 family peptidase n=1 Tax=Alkalicoccobacillus gibsonii TaxID=79881 RepID=UPI003515FDAC
MQFQAGKWTVGLSLVVTLSAIPAIAGAEDVKERYLIGFKEEADANTFSTQAETSENQVDVEILREYENLPIVNAELTEEEAEALEAEASIEYVEKDVKMSTMQEIPYGIPQVNAPVVHEAGNVGSGVSVAVIDTGIAQHEDLNIVGGESFVSSEPSFEDLNGHGTHVAGTVAALDNSVGVLGVAPEANLYAVKVLDQFGDGYTSDIAAGIEWAANQDIDIANLSLGGPIGSPVLEQAVDYAEEQGTLLIAAAGNSGTRGIGFPAAYENVVSVAAVDSENNKANFSSFGPENNIAAPGVDTLSTYPGGQYAELSGTSMASPHVAGVAALVQAANPSATASDIRDTLQTTATPLGNQEYFGSGLVNAEAAVGR